MTRVLMSHAPAVTRDPRAVKAAGGGMSLAGRGMTLVRALICHVGAPTTLVRRVIGHVGARLKVSRAVITRDRAGMTRYPLLVTRDRAGMTRYPLLVTRDRAGMTRYPLLVTRDRAGTTIVGHVIGCQSTASWDRTGRFVAGGTSGPGPPGRVTSRATGK